MEPDFPFEFLVLGTPLSLQAKDAQRKEAWRQTVKDAAHEALPDMAFAVDRPLFVTIYFFPPDEMDGDIDNRVKLILDGMCRKVYIDDTQIARLSVQKFAPGGLLPFANPSPKLAEAAGSEQFVTYIRVTDNIMEGLE